MAGEAAAREVNTLLSNLKLNEEQTKKVKELLMDSNQQVTQRMNAEFEQRTARMNEDFERRTTDFRRYQTQHDADRRDFNLRRDMEGMGKNLPKFFLGEDQWKLFWSDFQMVVSDYPHISEDYKKRRLYKALQGGAKKLAGERYLPLHDDIKSLTLNQYAEKLKNLFEPASESANAKMEFLSRVQDIGENPSIYLADKLQLFHKAWPAANQDLELFYGETTKGLVNEHVASRMYDYRPKSIEDYEDQLKYLMAAVRKKYLHGKISQAEALGAETQSALGTYRKTPNHNIKQEPDVNATDAKETRTCFYCKKPGHLISKCPRKAAGLAPTASVPEDNSEDSEDEVNYLRQGNPNRGGFNRYGGQNGGGTIKKNYLKTNRGRPYFKKSTSERKNQRVAVIYKDDEGHTCIDETEAVEEQGEDDPAVEEGINTVELEDKYDGMYTEADFLPAAFLGQ